MTETNHPHVEPDGRRVNKDSSSDDLEPVELLADDFMRRQRAGEKPTIQEYCEKYPELADEVREVFPALVVIEQVAPASADLEVSGKMLESPEHQPIESIGDYRILREIGRGGMGVVYEAEQESLGRRVALKVLPRHAGNDDKSLLRFQREARAAAKMHHTNIVPVFEVGQDKDHSFYAMQLIQGQALDHVIGDLRDLRSQKIAIGKNRNEAHPHHHPVPANSLAASLISGRFDQRNFMDGDSDDPAGCESPLDNEIALTETIIQSSGSTASATLPGQSDISTAENNRSLYFHSVAEIGLQSARALSYAHARGITHRDIKPSNLILDTAGVVWITDFGLAHTTDSSMTQTGDILGTIRYMSPERFKGQCDNRADVYSLGLTLYEMLVLKPAFESPDRLKLIDIVTKTEVISPRSIDSRVPRDLETIVLKACAKDPKRRYQSADDMADDLQRFINDEPIQARRTSSLERVARWSRRNPWLATAVSVAAMLLFAVAAVSTLAAQNQTKLNGQLTQANQEQKKLNDELKTTSEEQRKTNEELVETNRSKEQLIRDLKRSQSRLAEKQAEFIAEKGDIAESMLWLNRSYELAAEDDTKTRDGLLTKLQRSAGLMPRLVNERKLNRRDASMTSIIRSVLGTGRSATGAETSNASQPTQSRAVGSIFAERLRVGETPRVMVFGVNRDSSPAAPRVSGFRCYDVAKGDWTGVPIWCEGIPVAHDFHPEKRWLATVSFLLSLQSPETNESQQPAPRNGGRPSTYFPANTRVDVTEVLAIRNIDSGEIIVEPIRKVVLEDSQVSQIAFFAQGVLRFDLHRTASI